MNMEILLRGRKGVCWDLGGFPESSRPGFLQAPRAEAMGSSGLKQPPGQAPTQAASSPPRVWGANAVLEQGPRSGWASSFSRGEEQGPKEVPVGALGG